MDAGDWEDEHFADAASASATYCRRDSAERAANWIATFRLSTLEARINDTCKAGWTELEDIGEPTMAFDSMCRRKKDAYDVDESLQA